MKIYAGIGSRKTPKGVLEMMERTASRLARTGWILRSGGAEGADSAFERGCNHAGGQKQIFRARDAKKWAFVEAEKHMPANRPPFKTWKPYVRGLIARNMMQILGENGDSPVNVVLCWTPAKIKDGGGTGYAIRCALSRSISVYNLNEVDLQKFINKAFGE
ncbi:hypothetical protein LCGC14_2959220 [marine sediment metagenome]|uniref:NADPH-dependent FMN reductase-like domain-containing protein n=1 Tax=marine sediment metagenome TaxID=412755 RepID=A0A0F8ZKK0_9ZZZZ